MAKLLGVGLDGKGASTLTGISGDVFEVNILHFKLKIPKITYLHPIVDRYRAQGDQKWGSGDREYHL